MGERMIQCGTCANWFHMSCEGVEVESKYWKCTFCSDTGTVDMLHDVKQVVINDTSDDVRVSSDDGDSLGLSWKQVVKNVSQEYSDSCQPVDLHSFENFVKSSVRKAWVLSLYDECVPDFPSTPSVAAMDGANMQVICKYNPAAYEDAFDIIHRLIIKKNQSKVPLGQRGGYKALLVGAKVLQRYFKDHEASAP